MMRIYPSLRERLNDFYDEAFIENVKFNYQNRNQTEI